MCVNAPWHPHSCVSHGTLMDESCHMNDFFVDFFGFDMART